MSRIGVALLTVCLTAACTSAEEQRVASTPGQAALHLDPIVDRADVAGDGDADAAATGAHDADELVATDGDSATVATSSTAESATAESVAAEEVARLFELEGLFVLDLRPEDQISDATTTVVQVDVVFGTGRSHPTSIAYRVAVLLDGQQWTVTSIEELHGELRS